MQPKNEYLNEMNEIADKYGYRHDKPSWSHWPEQKKKDKCSRKTGRVKTDKMPDGYVIKRPMYCNLCDLCKEANAQEQIRDKINHCVQTAENSDIDGQWYKKIVEVDKEAKALKKRINRNEDGRYFASTLAENADMSIIFTYVKNEPGKDMGVYGLPGNPQDLDYKAIYQANRENNRKMSTGKAFKKLAAPPKGDVIKIEVHGIIIEDVSRQDEAEDIMRKTNYLEEAETADDVSRLYAYQLKFIIKALEYAQIEIVAIHTRSYNMAKERLVEDWNKNVKYWMSINASQHINKSDEKTDIVDWLMLPTNNEKTELVIN